MSDKFSYVCINPYAFHMLNLDFDLRQQKEKKNKATPPAGHPKIRLYKLLRNVALLICGCVAAASAQQTHVVTSLSDTGAGSLRDKIANANEGDTVQISPALLSNGNATITLNSEILIDKAITIIGAISGGDTVFVSGGNSNRAFHYDFFIWFRTTYIKDMAFVNCIGPAIGGGGAIITDNVYKLVVENCLFKNNSSGSLGGAIRMDGGKIVCKGSKFINNKTTGACGFISNQTGSGGAIELFDGQFELVNCQFINNKTCTRGGAVSFPSSDGSINNCHFEGNSIQGTSLAGGGAAYFNGISVTIKKTSFISNTSAAGGGAAQFFTIYSAARIEDCTFTNNTAQLGHGGAIEAYAVDTLSLLRCTFNDNTITDALSSGGAVLHSSSYAEVSKSTFYNNSAPVLAATGNLTLKSSTIANPSPSTKPLIYTGTNRIIQLHSNIVVGMGSGPAFTSGANVANSSYNIYKGNPAFSSAMDQVNLSYTSLAFMPLGNYGGLTETLLPGASSPALEMGSPNDFSDAQNASIFGRREVGAAEKQHIVVDSIQACNSATWWGKTYSSTGIYTDTTTNASSIDSVGVLYLDITSINTSISDSSGFLVAGLLGAGYQWIDCDSGYSSIMGATDSIFMPTHNGNYALVVAVGSCKDTSVCFSYNQVSAKEYEMEQFSVYPNPVQSELTIKLPTGLSSHQTVISIKSSSGQTLIRKKVLQESQVEIKVNLEDLPQGIYLIEWDGMVKRFVKAH